MVIFFYVLGLSCGFDHSKETAGVFMDIIAGYFSANLFVICRGRLGSSLQVGRGFTSQVADFT